MQSILELYTQDKKAKLIPKVKQDLTSAKWAIENLTLDKRIGIGTYSRVFAAHTKTNQECAIKILDDLSNHESVEYQKRLIIACNLCSTRSHSLNVPEIYRFEDRTVWKGNTQVHQIVIIMEKTFCSLYDIHKDKIKLNSPWSQDHLIKILLAVCNALSEGMKRDLCHFDVHEKNILVEGENAIFMLSDFGLPKVLKKRKNRMPYESDYLAPEAKGVKSLKEHFNKYKADVYSLGLVILKLMTLRDSFKIEERGDIPRILKEKEEEYPDIVKILREQMLIADPGRRENFQNVRFMILTVNFELSFSPTKLEDLLPKKTATNFYNMDMKEDMSSLIDIAHAYQYFTLYDKAIQGYNKAHTGLQKHDDYSKENAEMRTVCLARLGLIYLEIDNYPSALEHFNRLNDYIKLDSVKYRLGNDHPLYTHINQYIGVAYYSLNELDKAMESFTTAHELGKTNQIESVMNEKMCELYIGIVRFLQNDYMGSLREMVSVSDFIATLPQKDNFDNMDSLVLVGQYYRKLNAHHEALKVYAKARELALIDGDDDDDEYINVMNEIAATQKELKDYKNACTIQLNVLEKIRQSSDRKQFAQALVELADTLAKQDKLSEAIYTAEMAFKVFNRIYWLKHEKTVKAFKYLISLLKKSPEHDIFKKYTMLEDLIAPDAAVQTKWVKKIS